MDLDPDEHMHPGQEDLRWGSGIKDKERRKDSAPTAKYNKLSEQARRLIAGESQCAMFCGGKKCKYCTPDNWKPEQMAIKGLYSEWVTDNILAMARPSNHSMDQYHILEQFEECGIKTVINLQQPGEHAHCGYGNDSSGFSYNPQRLMEKEIFFYNFAWQDYGIAPMSTLLDIVKVMQFGVGMGKVAVHCHAGLGRTGLLIACYLVFNNRLKAGDAVRYVRSRRAGAIQTRQQVQTVLDFETHLKPFRTIFPSRVAGESEVSFKHFLNRQSHMLHGFEARRLKHIPKVVYVCCERLLQLAGQGPLLPGESTSSTSTSFPSCHSALSQCKDFVPQPSLSQLSVHSQDHLPSLLLLPDRSRASVSLEDLPNSRFKEVLSETKLQEDDSSSSSNSGEGAASHDVFINNVVRKDLGGRKDGDIKEAEDGEEEDDDDCIVFGKPDVAVTQEKPCQPDDPREGVTSVYTDDVLPPDPSTSTDQPDTGRNDVHSAPDNNSEDSGRDQSTNHQVSAAKPRRAKRKGLGERFKNRVRKNNPSSPLAADGQQDDRATVDSDDRRSGSGSWGVGSSAVSEDGGLPSVVVSGSTAWEDSCAAVCQALVDTDRLPEVRKKADTIEEQLNQTDEAWQLLAEEDDACVVSTVYWDWLNQLKEPVLRKQDLVYLLERTESPRECIRHLEKSVKSFVEYQASVLSKLLPQAPALLQTGLVERLLSHLTHQCVVTPSLAFSPPLPCSQPCHWSEMRSSEASHLVHFFTRLVQDMATPRERL